MREPFLKSIDGGKILNTEQRLTLNFTCYPLVTGQLDKYTFQDWQVEGGTIQLEVLDGADDCQKQDLKWSSSDETIAAVEQGKVRALTTGVADITVQAPNGAVGECRIQVIDNPGRLTPLKAALNTDRLVLNKTEGAMLHPHILPVDYFDNGRLDTTFTWTSSDPEVAVVDHRGGVYAAACGEAVITAVSNDIGRSVSCHIEVIKKSKQDLYADPLEDMQGICSAMNIGESRQLILPQEVCEQPVCWSSCNETIAGVDEHGCVRAYRAGEVHIWATFINGGHYVDYTVRIEPADEHPVTEVHLSRSRIRMTTGEQSALYAAVFPAVLLEKCLNWQSSDEKVCRIVRRHINLSGLDEIILEAAGAGRAVITGSCEGISQNCEVIVSEEGISVYSIQLPDKKKLECEAVERLIPVCAEDDTYSDYGWLSQDRTAATVDREGYVRAYKKGKVNIYCFALAGLTGSDRLL